MYSFRTNKRVEDRQVTKRAIEVRASCVKVKKHWMSSLPASKSAILA